MKKEDKINRFPTYQSTSLPCSSLQETFVVRIGQIIANKIATRLSKIISFKVIAYFFKKFILSTTSWHLHSNTKIEFYQILPTFSYSRSRHVQQAIVNKAAASKCESNRDKWRESKKWLLIAISNHSKPCFMYRAAKR